MIGFAEGENENVMPCGFQVTFVQVDVVCDAAYMGFVCIRHHANSHASLPFSSILRYAGLDVKEFLV
jgi:hypothetical protein